MVELLSPEAKVRLRRDLEKTIRRFYEIELGIAPMVFHEQVFQGADGDFHLYILRPEESSPNFSLTYRNQTNDFDRFFGV